MIVLNNVMSSQIRLNETFLGGGLTIPGQTTGRELILAEKITNTFFMFVETQTCRFFTGRYFSCQKSRGGDIFWSGKFPLLDQYNTYYRSQCMIKLKLKLKNTELHFDHILFFILRSYPFHVFS